MISILVIYIIGAIVFPIYMFLFWKQKRWNYTVGDLIFSIVLCWISWLGTFFLFIEYMSDKTLFRFNDKR